VPDRVPSVRLQGHPAHVRAAQAAWHYGRVIRGAFPDLSVQVWAARSRFGVYREKALRGDGKADQRSSGAISVAAREGRCDSDVRGP
jgi:hypothetical protein